MYFKPTESSSQKRLKVKPQDFLELIQQGKRFEENIGQLKTKICKRIYPFVTEYRPSLPNLKNILMTK